MATLAQTVGRHFDAGERQRLGVFYGIIVMLHVLGWGTLLLYVAPRYPVMVGLGGLAYTFGLRHAFDADHISAIDNTTRKLLQDKQKPMGVGFFFSLGHSTVVFLISLGLGLAVHSIVTGVQGGGLKNSGSVIGTAISGVFLLLIGLLNLIILLDILGVYRRMKLGSYDETELDHKLTAGGFMTRIFGRLFKLIRASWQLYFVGFLFGLGFDTATEVSLLAVSAGAVAKGLPLLAVLALPTIFAAGMALMDTTDGAFMAKAYSWAFSNPIRKVYYNLTVTGLSVFVALFVGSIEVLQILSGQFNWAGGFWSIVNNLDFNKMGFIIVAAFIVTWVAALTIWKMRRIEERWGGMVKQA